MTVIRATTATERSGAYLVRIRAIIQSGNNTKQGFDQYDTVNTNYIVIMEDGHPISTCRLYPLDQETIILGKIAVLPAFKDKGFDRAALENAEKWAYELGYRRAVLEDNHERVSFAKELGYIFTENQIEKKI